MASCVHHNPSWDITLFIVGPQLIIAICLYIYSCYNTDWIAYMEIGLDSNNSGTVIKRFWCISNLNY